MSGADTNHSERLIPCSFCNEPLSPSAVRDHLMICGNKTDECPRCKKFIRRAVFTYHFDNNCANLDDMDNDITDSTTARSDATTSHSIPKTATGFEKHRTVLNIDLSMHSPTQNDMSHRSNSDFCETKQITIGCPYCKQKCEIGERDIHQNNCLQNPNHIGKRQLPRLDHTSNSSSDRSKPLNQSDNIPCEYCNEPIKWKYYEDHMRKCTERASERMRNQFRPVHGEFNTRFVRCRYCNEERLQSCLKNHEDYCRTTSAADKRYLSCYQLPFLQN